MSAVDRPVRPNGEHPGFPRVAAISLRHNDRSTPLLIVVCVLSLVVGVVETVLLYLVARAGASLGANTTEVQLGLGSVVPEQSVPMRSIVIASLVLVVIDIALIWPVSLLAAKLSRDALIATRTRLLHAYLESSFAYRARHREGHFQDVAGDYCFQYERVVQQVATVGVAVFNLLAIGAGALLIAPVGASVAIVGLGMIGVLLRPLSRRTRRAAMSYASRDKEFRSAISQTARVSSEVASFNVGEAVFEDLTKDVRASARAISEIRIFTRVTPTLFQSGALAMVVLTIGALAAFAPGSLPTVGPVVLLLVRALVSGKQLQTALHIGNELSPYVLAVEDEIAGLEAHAREGGSLQVASFDHLRLRDLTFDYGQEAPVLEHAELTIAQGEVVGVIGPSGVGKSTLAGLVLGLLEPTGGEVLFDGVRAGEIQRESWGHLVAMVPQDNQLIRATVADNIRFYRTGFDDEQVRTAAKAAFLDGEILALPDGYDTMLGPGERSLSGGQRQRLGIARAMLGSPELLVLDEPTSALDATSEALIRDALRELRGRTTLLIIAHRPATLELCDRLVTIRDRRIVGIDDDERVHVAGGAR